MTALNRTFWMAVTNALLSATIAAAVVTGWLDVHVLDHSCVTLGGTCWCIVAGVFTAVETLFLTDIKCVVAGDEALLALAVLIAVGVVDECARVDAGG